jgi:hypothetical protein
MRVYRLQIAYNKAGNWLYQQIWPADLDHVDWFDVWSFRCAARSSVWPRGGALVEVLNPSAPAGNFPFLYQGAIGMDRTTRDRLAPILPETAEYLDVETATGQSYQLLNILDCTDSIDEERSEWSSLPTRARVYIKRFAFRPERLPATSLFKASAAPADLFVSTGVVPSHLDFKTQYEALGLRGLHFERVWSDDGSPNLTVV